MSVAVAAGIQAATSLFGSFFNRNENRRATSLNNAEARRQFNEVQHRTVQNRVADARAAGISPLAALGISPVNPNAHFIPGQPASGSSIGEGLALAGDAVAKGVESSSATAKTAQALAARLTASQIKATDAQALKSEAEAQLALSEAKRAETTAGHFGRDWGALNFSGNGAVTTPFKFPKMPGPEPLNGKVPDPHWKDITRKGELTTPGGVKWKTGKSTWADRVEQEYGDLMQNVYGTWRFLNDLRENINELGPRMDKYPWQ